MDIGLSIDGIVPNGLARDCGRDGAGVVVSMASSFGCCGSVLGPKGLSGAVA